VHDLILADILGFSISHYLILPAVKPQLSAFYSVAVAVSELISDGRTNFLLDKLWAYAYYIAKGVKIMARPKCCRRVAGQPACVIFKPAGIPASALDEIVLSMDEFEAIRLADFDGLYHEQAAEKMNVSRQTFGRIIEAARHKVAQVLVKGLALRIEGGEIEMAEVRKFKCYDCQHTWEIPYGTGRPGGCPACQSANVHRAVEDRGFATGGRRRMGQGRGCRGMQQK